MMFAKKQPEQLRVKLAEIQRDIKLNKTASQIAFDKQVDLLCVQTNTSLFPLINYGL